MKNFIYAIVCLITLLMISPALSAYEVTIGIGDQTARIPVDMYWKNSLFECLYYPNEMGFTGYIHAVTFYNTFNTNLPNKQTKIWLGTTTLPDLSGGWIPSTQLTPVFDGLVNYPNGNNTITITLSEPFLYTGDNLVMMVNRPLDSQYYSSEDKFYCQTIGTNRALKIQSDSQSFDPANPPTNPNLSGQFPKTTFTAYSTGLFCRFFANNTIGNVPLTIQFTDNSWHSDGTVTSWQWDFENDGIIDSYEQNPVHTYTVEGLYSVKLTVSDGTKTNTLIKNNYIRALPHYMVYFNDFSTLPGNEWSNQSITTSPSGRTFLGRFCNDEVIYTNQNLPPHIKLKIEFDLNIIASWDGNGPGNEEFWKLAADGNTLLYTTFSNTGTNQSYPDNYPANYPPHTGAQEIDVLGYSYGYWGDSVYHLSLEIYHNSPSLQLSFMGIGLEGIDNESWGIDNFQISYSDIIADFSANANSGCIPFTVSFTDNSLSCNDISSWQWDFNNDGIIDSNLQNPTWTYILPGTYTVSLTVSDGINTDTENKENIIHTENSTLSNGLVGYYPFTGNANDHSGFRNNGSSNNVILTADRFGRENSAYYFDGSAWITIPETFVFHHPGDASCSFWVIRKDNNDRPIFWSKTDLTTDANRFLVNTRLGGMDMEYRYPDGTLRMFDGNADATFPIETWTHIAIVRSGNTYFTYKNGQLVKTDIDTAPILPTWTGPWLIGKNIWSFAYGSIDDIRFYNRALTNSEIHLLYTSDTQSIAPLSRFSATPKMGVKPLQVHFTDESIQGLNPITSWQWDLNGDGSIESTEQNPVYIYPRAGIYTITLTVSDGTFSDTYTRTNYITVTNTIEFNTENLVAYYPFNGNANDASGNERNGQLINNPTFTEDRFGIPNQAITFNGTNNYVSIPYYDLGNEPVTISCWVKAITSANNYWGIISLYDNNTKVEYRIAQNGNALVICRNNPGYSWYSTSAFPISLNTWYNVTLRYSSSVLEMYLNGSYFTSITVGWYASWYSYPTEYCIGKGTGDTTNFFNGSVDDVFIYNRALNPSEIQDLYNYNPNIQYYGIIKPKLNDRWLVGSYKNIEWILPDNISHITIEYSADNGENWTEIVRSVPAFLGCYPWMVPDTPSENCKIRILNRYNNELITISDLFTIYLPTEYEFLTDGLIAYYSFNGNVNDESENGRNGQIIDGTFTDDRFGIANNAFHLDGLNDCISFGDVLPDLDTITFSFWIKPSGLSNGAIFSDETYHNGNDMHIKLINNSSIYILNSKVNPPLERTIQVGNLDSSQWYLITWTLSSTYSKLYLNSEMIDVVYQNSSNIGYHNFVIGTEDYYGYGYQGYYQGDLDEFRIYNRELSQDEIDLIYNYPTYGLTIVSPQFGIYLETNTNYDIFWYAENSINTVDLDFSPDNGITWQNIASALPAQQYHYNWLVPDIVATHCKLKITANTGESVIRSFSIVNNSLEAGLIAYYPLDGNANDVSGNGRDGTVNGLITANDRFGNSIKSLKIDDKYDYISIPPVNQSTISVSFWYYFEGTNGDWNTLLCRQGGDYHHLLINNDSWQIGFHEYNYGFHSSGYTLQQNKWYHFTMIKSGTKMKLYSNNQLIMNVNNSFNNALYPLTIIGNTFSYNQGSLGILDDVRIYNRELTEAEISYLDNNGVSVNISGHIVGSNNPSFGLSGAQIILGENLFSTEADDNGYFSFNNLAGNANYRLVISKAGYATQTVYANLQYSNLDLGTIILCENSNLPTAVTATQIPEATKANISWSISTREIGKEDQTREFINYSIYRLLVGEENNNGSWTFLATVTANSYEDNAWYNIPFGVYKYAVIPNYSNNYQGQTVFSNEIQRRNYNYAESFDHNGSTPEGWSIVHSGTTTNPWTITLDSGADYSYSVSNTSLCTANETLKSPNYNCARYDKVIVSFWHNYVPNTDSQARFQYSLNGVTWTTLATWTSTANSGIRTYDISSAANHKSTVYFRWLYTATSYNTNSWKIDDFSVSGYSNIPVYLANPYPAPQNRKVNSRTTEIGITYIDDEMVNASSLYYRIDGNGNGSYDSDEPWIPISGYSNAQVIEVRVLAAYQMDGEGLKYEFKGSDVAGNAVGYSGFNRINGIEDDYYVDIDTIAPTAVEGFSFVSAGYQSVTLSWQPVTEEHFADYEIYYNTNRTVDLNSNCWSTAQDPALGSVNTNNTTITGLGVGLNYWFRIRAKDLHNNYSELSPLLMYVSADLPPVISNPVPANQPLSSWQNQRTVNIGCTFADYYGIDLATIKYRYDRNGNGVYDENEGWQNLPASKSTSLKTSSLNISREKIKNIEAMSEEELEYYIRNREQVQVIVPVTFETDGQELHFEFQAKDIHNVGPVYTGFYSQCSIDDDWFVRIDSQNPADINSIYIGVVEPTAIEVSWQVSSDTNFQSYEVYYGIHPEITTDDWLWDWQNDPLLAYAGSGLKVTNITGLNENTRYYFRVRAIDEAGNTCPLSPEISAIYITELPPKLPENIQIQASGEDVILTWDPVTEDIQGNPITVTGYNIYASDCPDLVPDIGYLIDVSPTNSYTHIGITPYVDTIFYIVTAVRDTEAKSFDKPNDQRLRKAKK
ncbi:MAG TPA: PKD domain-containing protein [Candidatus Cloacimonas sp.]|jgi:PKD repeat protein|nr:PKD domain-containing protein [Candidatus Cloacimonas sp.]